MRSTLAVDDVLDDASLSEIFRQWEAGEYATWGLAFGRTRVRERSIPAVPPASQDRKMLLAGLAELIARDLLRRSGVLVLEDGRVYGGRVT